MDVRINGVSGTTTTGHDGQQSESGSVGSWKSNNNWSWGPDGSGQPEGDVAGRGQLFAGVMDELEVKDGAVRRGTALPGHLPLEGLSDKGMLRQGK